MSRAVKAGVLGLVIAATVWVLTLLQWRRAPEAVSGQEIILRLIVLPLLLTAVALLAWRAVKRLRALAQRPPQAGLAAGGAPGAVAGGTSAGESKASAEALALPEQPVATVLAEALCLAAGHGAAEAWQALKEGGVRPDLDPELSDADGLPVFSARVTDLDLHDWLLAHAELGRPGDTACPDPVLRALALLEGPLHRLLDALSQWQPDAAAAQGMQAAASNLPADAPSHLSGVGRQDGRAERQARAERAPILHVRLCLPAAWANDDRARATDWVRSQCGALLDWTEAHGAPPPQWHVGWHAGWQADDAVGAQGPEAVWSDLSSHWDAWSASPRPQLLLLLAADTAVDDACVAQWQARGELFTSHHQRGRVPGEAGVGLLLANRAWDAWCRLPADTSAGSMPPSPSASDDIAACPHLWRPHAKRRERSADVIGRADARGVQVLLAGVAERLAPHSEGDWLLVSDGDHRASRTAETFEGLLAVRPDADPMLSVVRVGDGCGDMGLARALVGVALASASLRQGDPVAMALALMVQDPLQRIAVPLTPPTTQWPVAAPPARPAFGASPLPDGGAPRTASA